MTFSKLTFRKAVSGLTAATALALGATVLAAPSASAVGSSACTENIKDQTLQVVQWDHADMYTSPSFKSKVEKSVFAGNSVRVYCTADHGSWYYGKSGKTTGWMEEHAFF
ncbi:SH3 domain-containing protein [Streptomyces sp. NPDC001118]|uniref:SH3 domain-containing protein n=1 Tax=unclassified Streptomyces TaxID=2593676 RepID=UPI003329FEA2